MAGENQIRTLQPAAMGANLRWRSGVFLCVHFTED